VGFTGVAAPLLELAAGLSSAGRGDVVLVAAAGDGASAAVGTVHHAARVSPAGAALEAALAAARPLPVGMFQRLRGQVPADPVDPYTSEMLLRREQAAMLQLRAPRCRGCGAVAFPARRVCAGCGAKDEMDEVELPRRGTLFTHTVEHLFPVPENRLIMGVVDLGPARLYTQVTDTEPDACAPGVPVDLVLRRLHTGGGTPHYFWKAKVRTTGEVGL
jgi:hydroxymethylglutaryl-CoA synthase